MPKPAQQTATHRPSPFTPERAAKRKRPSRAPTPASAHQDSQANCSQIVRSNQRCESLPTIVQNLVREDRHQHDVRHPCNAHDSKQHQQGAIGAVRLTNRNPSMMCSIGDECGDALRRSVHPHQHQSDNDRDIAHRIRKESTSPHQVCATRTPATAGPITRAPLNMDEFNAIAFIRSSLPDHVHEERLPPGNIESVHHAERCRENEDFSNGDAVRQRESQQG